jgi:hypothetical protein
MIQTGSKLTPGVHELPHGGDRYSRLLSQPCYVRVGEVGYDFSLLARGMVAPLKLSGTADPLDMKRFKQFKSMVPTLEYVHFSLCRDSHVTCGEVTAARRARRTPRAPRAHLISTANPSAQVHAPAVLRTTAKAVAKLWTGKDECTPLGSLETQTVRPIDGGVDVVYGGGAPCERGPPGATHKVTFRLMCDTTAQPGAPLSDGSYHDGLCSTLVTARSAAGCAISENFCEGTCPRTWVGDGACP